MCAAFKVSIGLGPFVTSVIPFGDIIQSVAGLFDALGSYSEVMERRQQVQAALTAGPGDRRFVLVCTASAAGF